MTYNLEANHYNVSYPHYTKKSKGEILIVTNTDTLLKVDDIIEAKNLGVYAFSNIKILEILETRPANGQHSIPNPIFQRCRI